MKEEYTLLNNVNDVLTKEALADAEQNIPDELLKDATGGALLQGIGMDAVYAASRVRVPAMRQATKAAIGATVATGVAAGAVGAIQAHLPLPGKKQ